MVAYLGIIRVMAQAGEPKAARASRGPA